MPAVPAPPIRRRLPAAADPALGARPAPFAAGAAARADHAIGIASADGTSTRGAAVSSVARGDPAAEAGLRSGDVVTGFEGKAVSDSSELVAAIAAREPGDKVQLKVRRGPDTVELTVELGTQPTPAAIAAGG